MYLVAVGGRRCCIMVPKGCVTVATAPLAVAPTEADSSISRIRIKDLQQSF